MRKFYVVLLTIITLMLLSIHSHAEVIFKKDTLTMNVQDATVHEVLNTLAQKTQIKIVALEETNTNNVRISKRFWGLPLEEGIHRVLRGWNYGISRDRSTGVITTLYLVSRRINSSTSGSEQTASTRFPSNRNISQAQSLPTALNQTYAADVLEPIHEEEFDGEEDYFNDEELEALPPNLIETLERWQRNGKG